MIESLEDLDGLNESITEVLVNMIESTIQESRAHRRSRQLLIHSGILVTVAVNSSNLHPIETTEHGKQNQEKRRSL